MVSICVMLFTMPSPPLFTQQTCTRLQIVAPIDRRNSRQAAAAACRLLLSGTTKRVTNFNGGKRNGPGTPPYGHPTHSQCQRTFDANRKSCHHLTRCCLLVPFPIHFCWLRLLWVSVFVFLNVIHLCLSQEAVLHFCVAVHAVY